MKDFTHLALKSETCNTLRRANTRSPARTAALGIQLSMPGSRPEKTYTKDRISSCSYMDGRFLLILHRPCLQTMVLQDANARCQVRTEPLSKHLSQAITHIIWCIRMEMNLTYAGRGLRASEGGSPAHALIREKLASPEKSRIGDDTLQLLNTEASPHKDLVHTACDIQELRWISDAKAKLLAYFIRDKFAFYNAQKAKRTSH